MKITTKKQRRKSYKPIIITTSVVVVLLIVAVIYLIPLKGSLFGWQPFRTSTPVDTTTQNSDDTSHGTKDTTTTDGSTDKTTDQIPVSTTLTAKISQLEQTNGAVVFTGSVNDASTGGKCSITFSNENDRPITRSADAVVVNNTGTCGPISVPENEFSFLGDWKATFRYYLNDSQAIAEGIITIK